MLIFEILTLIVLVIFMQLYRHEKKKNSFINLEYNILVAQSLGKAATLRDHETGIHNLRVTYIASLFGESLGLDRLALQNLMKGAFLHDVGKIGIPDKILLKDGSLDEDEWKVMQTHTTLGVELVENMHWFKDAQDVILHHHERYDGSGYPSGLKGEEIPYIARVFSFIDVFDALMSKRPYKDSFTFEKSLAIIEDNTPTQFDPLISTQFIHFIKGIHFDIYEKSELQLQEMLMQRRKFIFKM